MSLHSGTFATCKRLLQRVKSGPSVRKSRRHAEEADECRLLRDLSRQALLFGGEVRTPSNRLPFEKLFASRIQFLDSTLIGSIS